MSSLYSLTGIVFGVVSAIVARSKGRNSIGWFLAGMVIGPFGLVVGLLPAKPREGYWLQCPGCREVIQAEATVCRYCGTRLSPL